MAVNLYIKYGLGSIEELSEMLYACTTCRRCQERCKMLSTDCGPADIILKARRYLVKRAELEGGTKYG
jgi:heterodisulfide reductase subunit C